MKPSVVEKISIYKVTASNFIKAFCSIVEKCYYSNFRTLVVVEDNALLASLDTSLWTYSKKHFIPHATYLDPEPERQPVFFTAILENLSNSNCILLVNPTKKLIMDMLAKNLSQDNFPFLRILCLHDDNGSLQPKEMVNIFSTSSLCNVVLDSFIQQEDGSWQKA